MTSKKYLLIILVIFLNKSFAQDSSPSAESKLTYFVSLNYGYQMSGIKDEDFISSNYSPLFNITEIPFHAEPIQIFN